MCMKSKKAAIQPEPIKYAQQKTPNRRDTADAQSRTKTNRARATKTLLAENSQDTDQLQKKTLLGG